CVVVLIRQLQPLDHRAHGGAFGCAKLAVLQIEVVDDRAYSRNRRFLDAEDRAQGFEGATLALVTEFDPEHVKRHVAISHRLPINCETKSSLSVDEAPNQPGRSHSIDAWPGPGNPQAFLKRRHLFM